MLHISKVSLHEWIAATHWSISVLLSNKACVWHHSANGSIRRMIGRGAKRFQGIETLSAGSKREPVLISHPYWLVTYTGCAPTLAMKNALSRDLKEISDSSILTSMNCEDVRTLIWQGLIVALLKEGGVFPFGLFNLDKCKRIWGYFGWGNSLFYCVGEHR